MRTFGECSIEIAGRRRILRGSVKIMNAGLETKVEPNMDGTVYQTAATKPVMVELELEDVLESHLTAQDLITPKDITFVEEMSGVTHFFSSAKMQADPNYDPATGVVAGLAWACARSDYRRQRTT